MTIFDNYAARYERTREEEFSLSEYLALCKKDHLTYATAPERMQKIMHARISFDGEVLMASDAPPDRFQKPQGFAVSITVDDPAEGERKFKALSEGGSVNMPFGKTFFSKGFGMCVDQFGISWMVNCPIED